MGFAVPEVAELEAVRSEAGWPDQVQAGRNWGDQLSHGWGVSVVVVGV
jgi:hypothetical protein